MIQTNLRSEKLEHYTFHRSRLISLCDEAADALAQAQQIQKRPHSYSTPADKLRADSYTLVLIGAFQSGKSTLFNYLCDGRELSPIGPGGGGLRTSGCMVTAHPVKEGGEERAVITWRKPEELLAALGASLVNYYENPTSYSALTTNEVNLDRDEDRAKLAEFAVKELTDSDANLSNEEKELLRFTLIVCRFYKNFAEKCKKVTDTCTPDEAVALTSYPQDWANKWCKTQETNSWEELPEFSVDEVNFAFCGGVELFLDSPVLRNIGCSIIDCPGLFISKWDTDIATRCIKAANAILYMFAGNKSLTQEDLQALKECVRLGGSHKMIFGANVRVSLQQWENILNNGVLPTLKQNRFDSPVVHNFHSAIALRSRELMYQEYDMLPPSSKAAIALEISLKGKPMSVEEFLRRELKKFIRSLTDDEEELSDYEGKYPELEKLSGVPDFVGAASNHVLETRATSVLIHEGTKQLEGSLTQAKSELNKLKQLLEKNLDEAKTELSEENEKLKQFRESRNRHENSLSTELQEAIRVIYQQYDAHIQTKIGKNQEKLIQITCDLMPSTLAILFTDKNKLIQKYNEAVGQVLSTILEEIRGEILKNFKSQPSVVTLKDAFEGHRKELMQKLEFFKEIEPLTNKVPQFPDKFVESVNGMVLPKASELMEQAYNQANTFVEWMWTILTFGVFAVFRNNKARATAIVNAFIGDFKKITSEQLKTCMEQENPPGPVKVLQNIFIEFKKGFNIVEGEIRATLDKYSAQVQECENATELIPRLESVCRDLSELEEKCRKQESEIRKDFPSVFE